MKRFLSSAVLGLVLGCSIPKANAADHILKCSIGHDQGIARIKVLLVVDHPEIQVFDLRMKIKPVRAQNENGIANLAGLLAARIGPSGSIIASGTVLNEPNSSSIINPESITLQGSLRPDGTFVLSLYDQDRVLQAGFGTIFRCR